MAGRDNWRELSFNGRSAVVTGAARGIGRAISYRLAGLGARTVIWDRDGAVAERTAIELRDLLNSQGRPHHHATHDRPHHSHHEGDAPMTNWTSDELTKIGTAEELEIASLRRDGTERNPVTIWVVRLGDDLYVRSVNGRTAAWFRGTQVRHEGRIWAGGVEKDVTFVDADPNLSEQIDAAYRTKYRRYAASIIRSIVSPEARSATIKLVPRATSS